MRNKFGPPIAMVAGFAKILAPDGREIMSTTRVVPVDDDGDPARKSLRNKASHYEVLVTRVSSLFLYALLFIVGVLRSAILTPEPTTPPALLLSFRLTT